MAALTRRSPWAPRIGGAVALAGLAAFVLGLARRAEEDVAPDIRMLFVPSVEQGTLVRRGNEMARFVTRDSGLTVRTEVPTSYAAVIQALGSEQADVAWMPAFAYVLASARYGAEAKLQVVRTVDRYGILFAREAQDAPPPGPEGRGVAFPRTLPRAVADRLLTRLDESLPGWKKVPAESDKDAVRMLLDWPAEIAAAAGTHVFSGPNDFVGDGRKELEYDRPGTLEKVRVLYTTPEPEKELATVYFGCVFARTDSGIQRLEHLSGLRYAFADETSTSGHIYPRMLLERRGVELGRDFYAGGHPNAVQAVWDGKADGGSAFYSPPGERQVADGSLVGDARAIILRRMERGEERRRFLEQVRILALTDPIPNDVCVVRRGFPEERWRTFAASLNRFIETEEGRSAYFDLVAGVAAAPTSDGAFDDFRKALKTSGLSAEALLRAQEAKLEDERREREKGGGD